MARLVAWFIELRYRFNEPRVPKVSTLIITQLKRVGCELIRVGPDLCPRLGW